MTAEDLRKIQGGVIGAWTPKEILIDMKDGVDTGDLDLGLEIPKGKIIIGSYMVNEANDIAYEGTTTATMRLKAGATSLGSAATNASSLKGSGVYAPETAGVYTAAKTKLYLTVATAALTAGKVKIGIIYI